MNLAVDIILSDTAGYQLCVLRPEVQDENGVFQPTGSFQLYVPLSSIWLFQFVVRGLFSDNHAMDMPFL